MKNLNREARIRRERRHHRVRAKVHGTVERPRLAVFRSLSHIYAQVIDDLNSKTLVAASDMEVKKKGAKTELAKEVGLLIAKKAKEKGIEKVVFDRGAYRYHGRIKSLADAAREGGLQF